MQGAHNHSNLRRTCTDIFYCLESTQIGLVLTIRVHRQLDTMFYFFMQGISQVANEIQTIWKNKYVNY